MDDLSLLHSFLSVYRAGSITRAGRALNLTQPAVTQHIQALERRVGRDLFRRGPRGVTPTRAGRELAQACAGHLDALDEILGRGTGSPAAASTVVLGGPEEFMSMRVMPALVPLVQRQGFHVRARFGLVDRLLPMLRDGEVDIVVATTEVEGRDLEYEALCIEYHALVAAPHWRERIDWNSFSLEPAEALAHIPLVAFDEELPLIREFWRDVFDARPRGRAQVVADGLRAIERMVIDGVGMTVLPRHVCEESLRTGRIVELYEPLQPVGLPLMLAMRAGAPRTPELLAVRERVLATSVMW